MKKMFFLSLLGTGAFFASSAQSYPGNNGYPQSYPNGQYSYPANEYYYYPDANVYFNPASNNYIYYDQNRWCSNSYVPDYMGFNNRMPSVVINYRGRSVWDLNNDHRRMYSNNRFNNRRPVIIQQDIHRNNRGYGNRGYGNNRRGMGRMRH